MTARVQRIPLRDGDEYDAFTGWRRVVNWKPGERKSIKRRYAKRVRATIRGLSKEELTNERA